MAGMSKSKKDVVIGPHERREKEKEKENWCLRLLRENAEEMEKEQKELEDAYKAAGISYNPVMDAIRANPAALASYTQGMLRRLALKPHREINEDGFHLDEFERDFNRIQINKRRMEMEKMEMEKMKDESIS
jgi:hypothetical protein